MVVKGRSATAFAVGAVFAGLSSGAAHASLDRMPRMESQCLSTKQVLRTSGGARLADIQPGGKVKLVSVRICTAERRACFAQGDEVPMSRCAQG